MNKPQAGVALISVLFVMVITSVLLAQLLASHRITIERTRWLVDDAQAYEYALGEEQLARQLLFAGREVLKGEGLAISPIPPPATVYRPERGEIRLQIVDLQGLLNLNNVSSDNQLTLIEQFGQQFLFKPGLAALLEDWVDGDTLPRPGGAEDLKYLAMTLPYRAANRKLADPSELQALADLDPQRLGAASQWLTALEDAPRLNINTLPANLVTLIHPGLSPAQFEAVRRASPTGFHSVEEFRTSHMLAGLSVDPSLLTAESSFFSANLVTKAGDARVSLASRFRMDSVSGRISLLDRNFLLVHAIKAQLGNPPETIDESADFSF